MFVNSWNRSGLRVSVALAGTMLAVAACSSSGGGGAASTGAAAPGTTTTTTATTIESGTSVAVTAADYSFALPSTEMAPGTYRFVVNNDGKAPHALTIKGPGVDSVSSEIIEGGQKAELTVTLQTGDYEVWCPVGNHRGLGMETALQVK